MRRRFRKRVGDGVAAAAAVRVMRFAFGLVLAVVGEVKRFHRLQIALPEAGARSQVNTVLHALLRGVDTRGRNDGDTPPRARPELLLSPGLGMAYSHGLSSERVPNDDDAVAAASTDRDLVATTATAAACSVHAGLTIRISGTGTATAAASSTADASRKRARRAAAATCIEHIHARDRRHHARPARASGVVACGTWSSGTAATAHAEFIGGAGATGKSQSHDRRATERHHRYPR